jgi:hypothetical protein
MGARDADGLGLVQVSETREERDVSETRFKVRTLVQRRCPVEAVYLDTDVNWAAVAEWSGGTLVRDSDDVYISLPPVDGVRGSSRVAVGGEWLVKVADGRVLVVDPTVLDLCMVEVSSWTTTYGEDAS